MKDLPSINQVAILGVLTHVEHKPHNLYSWQFQLQVQSDNRQSEAVLHCGAREDNFGRAIQGAKVGKDWVLINGKIRKGGFIQVRDLYIIGEIITYPSPIHHVALMGEITAIRNYPESIYVWQFDLNIYREYGNDDKDKIETTLTCGLGGDSSYYNQIMEAAQQGQWAKVQGKVRNNGFIQVRSFCIFDMS